MSMAPFCAFVSSAAPSSIGAAWGAAGGGAKAWAAASGLRICAAMSRTSSQLVAWLGLTAIKWPRNGRPSSDRSPTISSIFCRTNTPPDAPQAAAFDQAIVDQELDFLVKAKRARVREIALPGRGRQFDAVELGKPALLIGARAGDLERLRREQRHHRLTHLQLDRRRYRVRFLTLVLGHDPRALDHLAILARAAVRNGRLIGIQLHDGVVDAVAGKRRQHVLHRVDARVPFGQRRRAIVLDYVLRARLDLRLALQVHPAEPDARVGRRREKGHGHPVAAVQANPGIARGAI